MWFFLLMAYLLVRSKDDMHYQYTGKFNYITGCFSGTKGSFTNN